MYARHEKIWNKIKSPDMKRSNDSNYLWLLPLLSKPLHQWVGRHLLWTETLARYLKLQTLSMRFSLPSPSHYTCWRCSWTFSKTGINDLARKIDSCYRLSRLLPSVLLRFQWSEDELLKMTENEMDSMLIYMNYWSKSQLFSNYSKFDFDC